MSQNQRLIDELTAVQDRLAEVWNDIGYNDAEKESKANYVYTVLMAQLEKIEREENRFKKDTKFRINDVALKLNNITRELRLPDVEPEDRPMTLIQLEKFLNEQYAKFQKEKCRRIKVVEKLCEEEKIKAWNKTSKVFRRRLKKGRRIVGCLAECQYKLKDLDTHEKCAIQRKCNARSSLYYAELCYRLDEKPINLSSETTPSIETIQFLQSTVNTLEEECEQRFKSFKRFKALILSHMETLDMKPSSPFEWKVASEVEELFSLKESNMRELKSLNKSLEATIEKNAAEERKLTEDIDQLWMRLKKVPEDKDAFLSCLTDNSARNIPKLKEMLKELKEQRKQNLGHYINTLRRELEELWERCFVSEDEKENFLPYLSDAYTDESWELHEQEVQRLKTFYNDNEVLFRKVDEWHQCWSKFRELEEREKDPNRLFGNRAGALLQEQKDRKRVKSKLLKLESELWDLDNVHSNSFIIGGQPVMSYINSQKHEFEAEKLREIESRQEARSRQLKIEARLGSKNTTSKRLNPTRADTFRTSKFLKTSDHTKAPGTGSINSYGSTLSRCSSKSNLLRTKSAHGSKDFLKDQSIYSGVHAGQRGLSDSTVISSYDKFTEAIHNRVAGRENIRSSVLPKKSGDRRSPRQLHTGSSTPKVTPKTLPATSRPPRPLAPANRNTYTPMSSRNVNQSKYMQQIPVTLPRRRSTRLENRYLIPRITPSPMGRSRCTPVNSTRLLTPLRNKLSFLM